MGRNMERREMVDFFFCHKIFSRITNCIRIQKLLPGVPFVQENLPSNPQTCGDDWGHLDNKTLMFDKKTPIRGPAIIIPSNVA